MRTFLAGGSGVLGRRLVPLLVTAGHTVAATTRSADQARMLEQLGAEGIVLDVYDGPVVHAEVARFRPDLLLNQLTALPDDPRRLVASMAATNRIRTEGLRILLSAARAAGVGRFASQSAAWQLDGDAADAVAQLEDAVLELGGTVLRYGRLYGPDTYSPTGLPPRPRIHVDEAARRTVAALEHGPGIVTITDDATTRVVGSPPA